MTLSRPLARSSRILIRIASPARPQTRSFFQTAPRLSSAPNKNRIYTSVRTPDELSNLLLISASTRRPLITLWTASWCPSCRAVSPLIHSLVESGAGEKAGGVGYAEVEVDAATIGELPLTYRITSMPTLLAFDRGEAQFETRVTDVAAMKDEQNIREWVEREASRRGEGGAGGGTGVFGGGRSLLGKWFG
ncbi:Thioredoxin [Neofusicoccum parvum]|nr:Thioredoxin [Neofusicoccum parvum]